MWSTSLWIQNIQWAFLTSSQVPSKIKIFLKKRLELLSPSWSWSRPCREHDSGCGWRLPEIYFPSCSCWQGYRLEKVVSAPGHGTPSICVPPQPQLRLSPNEGWAPASGKGSACPVHSGGRGPPAISLYPEQRWEPTQRPSAPASLSRLHERNSNTSLP